MSVYVFQAVAKDGESMCFTEKLDSDDQAEANAIQLHRTSRYYKTRWIKPCPSTGEFIETGDWIHADYSRSRNQAPGPSQYSTQELLRELDLLRNEVATYRECGILRMEALAALIADQAKEIGNIDAGEKARR